MDKNRLLTDFLNEKKDKFQAMQDNFAQALDFAFVTVDYRGEPLLEYSGFTEFCNSIRKDKARRKLCYQCDAHGGLHATITGEPYIYKCHAGLVDFAVPLIVEGEYLGAVMGGQLEICGEAPEFKSILAQQTVWMTEEELVYTRKSVHTSSYKRLIAGIDLLRETIQNTLERGYQNLLKEELEQKNQELLHEKETRFNIETKMASGQVLPILDSFREEELFDILNAISCLAFVEQAEGVQQMVCNFSEMLRTLMNNRGSSFVTLGDELEYTDSFLKIQEKCQEGRLTYRMNIPEEFYGVSCPFMLIQSLMQRLLRCAMERGINQGTFFMEGRKEEGLFVLD
ncbi:MAG: PocR ligand-binding domain-containing protein, partial [Hespellia sp.]|nr:PocR ligand-binding domain-containing protein [Hespellia sp.]